MAVPLFISYAREDHWAVDRVLAALHPLMLEGLIDSWTDRRMSAGDVFDSEIEEALNRSRVGILLLSLDFFASDYINTKELPKLVAAHQERGLRLFLVILNDNNWKYHPVLCNLQTVNKPDCPV